MGKWLAVALLIACGGGQSPPPSDAPMAFDVDPVCTSLDNVGGFPDCSVCDELGAGCDTLDINGSVSNVCDCSAPCPCGLRCGDIEIAPGVVVGNICIR